MTQTELRSLSITLLQLLEHLFRMEADAPKHVCDYLARITRLAL